MLGRDEYHDEKQNSRWLYFRQGFSDKVTFEQRTG